MAKRFQETEEQIVHNLVKDEDLKFAILITVDEGNNVAVGTATNEDSMSEGASILLSRIYEAIWPRNKQRDKCANKYPI